MREIYAIMCPNCKEWYKYYPQSYEEDIEFFGTETDCWNQNCRTLYVPACTAIKMDEFIFNAIKRCHM